MSKLKKSFPGKKVLKHAVGKCVICGEQDYDLLDTHRLKEGSEGGKYTINNTVIICCRCHRLQQAGTIIIDGWFETTIGRKLHWFDKNSNEYFS